MLFRAGTEKAMDSAARRTSRAKMAQSPARVKQKVKKKKQNKTFWGFEKT
jgi:hypothetical protein